MSKKTKLYVVVATRETKESFFTQTATGKSYSRFKKNYQKAHSSIHLHLILFTQNKRGLPSVYNQAIQQTIQDDAIILFLHDDVELCDFWWAERLTEGLQHFDIIGLAGCLKREPHQPIWCGHLQNNRLVWLPHEHLSLGIGHRDAELATYSIARIGATRVPVQLLDGVFLACRSETLRNTGLRFDEQFWFHFYDLDFCRHAEKLGLSMGTWDISAIHDSAGAFHSPAWADALSLYLQKWGE